MEPIVQSIVTTLQEVEGLEAIVLGGSRAKGTHSAASDIDIGIYYDPRRVDFDALERKAQELDGEHRENLLARPGGWGKWQNGGCWLNVEHLPVDLILRDMDRVRDAVQECGDGIVTQHYQTGHPHAYSNAMYRGELAICKPLWVGEEAFTQLKVVAESYPPEMKKSILALFSFEMGFSLQLAQKSMDRDDAYYVAAHLVRSVSAMNQVLFALNETYCINEKQAVSTISSLPVCPPEYKARIDGVFSLDPGRLQESCTRLKALVDEVSGLCQGMVAQ